MKKYLLLLLLTVLISCSESNDNGVDNDDDDKKTETFFDGTETFVFESEMEEYKVFDYYGEITDTSNWTEGLKNSKKNFDISEEVNFLDFKINDNFITIKFQEMEIPMSIKIENNQITTTDFQTGKKLVLFDILENKVLVGNSVLLYFYDLDEDSGITTHNLLSYLSYDYYDGHFDATKPSLTEGEVIALIKKKRTFKSSSN